MVNQDRQGHSAVAAVIGRRWLRLCLAAALLALIEDGSAERFLGWPERLAVRLNGGLGALLDGSFARHRRSLPPPATPSPGAAPTPNLSTGATP